MSVPPSGRRVRPLVVVLTLVALTSVSSATPQRSPAGMQTPVIKTPAPEGTVLPGYTRSLRILPAGDFEELAFGRYFGDEERTLVAQVSAEIVSFHDPSVFDAQALIAGAAGTSSLTTRNEPGLGNQDDLLHAQTGGLAETLGDEFWNWLTPSTFTPGAWQSAELLRSFRESGFDYLIGVSSDHQTLKSVVRDSLGVWDEGISVPLTAAVLDLAAVDFDDDGEPEIAALFADEVVFFSLEGTVEGSLPSSGFPLGRLEMVMSMGRNELLAWATLDDSEDPVLEIYDGLTLEGSIDLRFAVTQGQGQQDIDLAEMTAGDLDGDGLGDLVISDFASHRAVVLYQTGGVAHFSSTGIGTNFVLLHVWTPPGQAGPENDCQPLIADIDGDKQNDIVFALDSESTLVFFDDLTPVDGSQLMAESSDLASATSFFNVGMCEPPSTQGCTDGDLNLAFDIQDGKQDVFDFIQVSLWKQPTETTPLSEVSVSNALYPFFGDAPRDPHQWAMVDVPEPWISWPNTEHYFIRYRFVRANAGAVPPKIYEASPGRAVGFTLRHTGSFGDPLFLADFPYLAGLSHSGYGFLMWFDTMPVGTTLQADPGVQLGGFRGALGGGGGGSQAFGNNYVGALYVDVTIPEPPSGGNMQSGGLIAYVIPQLPW